MARNKHPEETRKKILNVARQLFYEKGYDNTTIQDIINELGGLTKGVIYHHFKSKKDILESVIESFDATKEHKWYENWQGNTGFEKIKCQLLNSLKHVERFAILYSAEVLLKSPSMIGEVYLSGLNEEANYLKEYIDEGIEDGSIVTNYPKELSEFISLTLNIWLGLNIVKYSKQELENKMYFLQNVFQAINVPLIDDIILNATFSLYNYIQNKK